MSSRGLMWALAALVALLMLFLLGGVAYLLWPQASDAIEADTLSKASHAADAPGPALIGHDALATAPTDPIGPESAGVSEPLAAKETWQLDFKIEGAEFWMRASFVPLGRLARKSVTGGKSSGVDGGLAVAGSGRLVIHAMQRQRWISDILRPPELGRMKITALLHKGLAVSGVVVGPDGTTPITSAFVRVRQAAPADEVPSGVGVNFRVPLNDRGEFRVEGLHPGEVRVLVSGPGVRRPGVRVPAQAGDELTIRLKPHGVLNLRLFDSTTRAAPGSGRLRLRYPTMGGGEQTLVTSSGNNLRGSQREGEPKRIRLVSVPCGEMFVLKIRAHGYASTDVEVQLPASGGEQTLDVVLERDASTATVLRVALRADGALPERLQVLLKAGRSTLVVGRAVKNGEIQLLLDPEVTQVTIGRVDLRADWAAVTIPISDSALGATIRRNVTLEMGGHLVFATRPPRKVVTLERDGLSFTRKAIFVVGTSVVNALRPGTWRYRIDGGNEVWSGDAIIRAGEATFADPHIEMKDVMAAPTPVVPR